ncbi:uncharacterized protein LOC127790148 [Diospyros lotus]|uniref:uncharacterized protein LOC127790148 n=1 Tax=Diospyros lotus TaxID=55363 RepID=UPI0022562582|nr:uncharacterized protein LOC127790148 [Diospyros lotus]
MECNKDESVRAKVIAERKLTEKDFGGAKKFAMKAQSLYPGLEGLSQMLTIVDVYIAAENKVSGEVDWYGILGVNPSADDDTVRKQYRKLALMLHPDKNKSIGADGAFKLISEAWSLLSDKAKRLAYNERRSSKGFHQKVPVQSGGPSAPPTANGFHNFSNRASSNARMQTNTAQMRPTSVGTSHRRADTFWTICHRCSMHYEYLRIYLNHNLLCPNCRQAFMASETGPPASFSNPSGSPSQQRYQNPNHHAPYGNRFDPGRYAGATQNPEQGRPILFSHTNIQQGSFARTAGVARTVSPPAAANVVQQENEKLKRKREEALAGGGGEMHLKKRGGLDSISNGNGGNTASHKQMGNGGAGMGGVFRFRKGGLETDRAHGFSGGYSKPNSTRELTQLETRNMLMKKACTEISKKLNEWNSETPTKAGEIKKEKLKVKEKEKMKNFLKDNMHELNGNGVSSRTKERQQDKKRSTSTSADDTGKQNPELLSINVPDPDFHDFDLDRSESSFGDSQVWAAYDDDDGMPRFYAMIHKVISLKPFKMRISWLNSKTNSEFGPIDWVGSGFTKTCGDLRIGKYEMNKSLNSFSHKVKWEKGPRGTICIYPKKGDVWALYRNWSPDWNAHTPDEVIHKYDMVEVLEDYSEDQGVSVAPLVKVAGFRTVFCTDMDPEKVRKIPKEEMFRLSHQVPNYLLTGLEAQNAPKGCQELDPAATPLELLQVIVEGNGVTIEENRGKAGKVLLQSSTETRVDEIGKNIKRTKDEELGAKNEETKEKQQVHEAGKEMLQSTTETKVDEIAINVKKTKEEELGGNNAETKVKQQAS